MASTIPEAIAENAIAGVKNVTVDGVSATAMSVDEQINAAKYLAGQDAVAQNHFGLRFVKLVPPGGG